MPTITRVVAALGAFMLVVAGLVSIAPAERAEAADAASFSAGNLISDANFFNGNAMSAPKVQSFLNAAVRTCKTDYLCLKDFSQATPNRAAVSGRCAAYQGSGGESAAQIIAKVGAACGISQKAIIVLLEKEQSLVTDDWPNSRQYRSAMGYGCPDTADCDAEYYGFFNQVYAAALQFKNYAANPTRWNHVAGRVNAIRFNPDAGCGSSNVYIQNQATAGLYNYTPYQPNASALANLYGRGDGCGAYGNRNFWRIYTDWFGNPAGGPDPRALIDWEYAAQGGPTGSLGTATSDYLVVNGNGGGVARAYQGGSIYYGSTTGVAALTVKKGPVLDYYFARGGASGPVGWPLLNLGSVSENGGGVGQVFSGGSVFSSSAGTYLVAGEQRDAYFMQGGAAGPLGWPTFDARCASVGAVPYCYQAYQGGGTYANNGTGAYPVFGANYQLYAAAGGPSGTWGLPVSGQQQLGRGLAQAFFSSSIYTLTGASPVVISGGIRDQYFSLSGAFGSLGWPLSNAVCSGTPTTCVQRFEPGYILQTAGQPARVGAPELDAAYTAAGGATGALGPATGPISILANQSARGLGQIYRSGSIFWRADLGAFAVSGSLRDAYFSTGGAYGYLGWPKGAPSCAGAVCNQLFESGTLFTGKAGSGSSNGAIATAYAAAGGVDGSWGLTRSDVLPVTANGGGTAQVFASGSAYAAAGGAGYLVSGPIRDAYFANGGAAGAFGWPTGEQVCAASGGTCSQSFQGGQIFSDGTKTASVSGPIRTAFEASGGPTGPWGAASGDTRAVSADSGVAQAFARGSAYAKNGSPVYFVPLGALRDYYFANGGALGSLGWPTSNASCAPDGSCSQTFEQGKVVAPASGPAVRQ